MSVVSTISILLLMTIVRGKDVPCSEDRDGYICHHSDPGIFIRCINGRFYEFYCPSGLHFSTATQTCDWPDKADCGSSNDADKHNDLNQKKFETEEEKDYEEKSNTTPLPWWKPKSTSSPWWEKTTVSSAASHNRSSDDVQPVWGESCDHSSCMLPDCRCPGTTIPGGLGTYETPQMVMLTFDDEMNNENYGYFQRLYRPGRYNPNGCPVRGTLYVSGEGTDFDLVYPMYAMGNEIASHTLSHRFPHTWWATASYEEYIEELDGIKEKLVSDSGIPADKIKGFRVPFLQLGGDNMYQALYDSKIKYDSSMFTGSTWEGEGKPIWPFTLDYVVDKEYCLHGPCPEKTYPGLWEIPCQRWYGLDGHSCAMADGCTSSGSADETLQFLRSNFQRYYTTNRAPFGIFVHARWFKIEHHLDALDTFIDELMEMHDVWIVTPSQVLEWMKKPTSVYEVQFFQPWSCDGSIKDAS